MSTLPRARFLHQTATMPRFPSVSVSRVPTPSFRRDAAACVRKGDSPSTASRAIDEPRTMVVRPAGYHQRLPAMNSPLMRRRAFLFRALALPAGILTAGWREAPSPSRPLPPEPWRQGSETLEAWRRASRQPVWESADPRAAAVLAGWRGGEAIRFLYVDQSNARTSRVVSPGLLFTVAGFSGLYLSGFCHLRGAERAFLLDRMRLPTEPEPRVSTR